MMVHFGPPKGRSYRLPSVYVYMYICMYVYMSLLDTSTEIGVMQVTEGLGSVKLVFEPRKGRGLGLIKVPTDVIGT